MVCKIVITAVETRGVVRVQRMEGSCYKIQVVQGSLVDKVTFEQRPEGNIGARLQYLGEEHCWQREWQMWKPWSSVVLDLCEEEVETSVSGVGWARKQNGKIAGEKFNGDFGFHSGTSNHRIEAGSNDFFLPCVLKSLLWLLGEKSTIRGQGWTKIFVAKIQARDDGGSVKGWWKEVRLYFEGRVNYVWKFSPHRLCI